MISTSSGYSRASVSRRAANVSAWARRAGGCGGGGAQSRSMNSTSAAGVAGSSRRSASLLMRQAYRRDRGVASDAQACDDAEIMRLRVLVIAALVAPLGVARAGNEDTYLFGDHASLMAGAVSPTANGTGAVWYNPAGLGLGTRSKLELSGSAFMLQIRPIPNMLLVTYPGGAQEEIRSTRAYIVPSSLVWVRNIKGVNLGLGVFVTQQDLFRFDGAIKRGPSTPPLDLDMAGQFSGESLRYHIGGSFGLKVTPR